MYQDKSRPRIRHKFPLLWLQRRYAAGRYSVIFATLAVIGMLAIAILIAPGSELASALQSGLSPDPDAGAITVRGMLFSIREAYHAWVPGALRGWVWTVYTNPLLYTIVPLMLLLEFLIPCREEQPLLSAGFFQDAIWFSLRVLADPFLLGAAFLFLKGVYDDYLSFLTIQAAMSWPLPLQIVLGVVLGDFLSWLGHVTVHKIRQFWVFHAVHHSQEQMNVFTDDRAHWFDLFFRQAVTFVPFFMLQVDALATVAVISVFRGILQRFIHCNIQFDFGVLGYVLVSPQFHRVHHSKEARHRDKNFGVLLSVWDYLFGTAYRVTTEYPATGISDAAFPRENQARNARLLWTVGRQILYPFVQLFRDVKKWAAQTIFHAVN